MSSPATGLPAAFSPGKRNLRGGPGRHGGARRSSRGRSPSSQNIKNNVTAQPRSPSKPRSDESRPKACGDAQASGVPGNQQPKKSRVNKITAKANKKAARGRKTAAAKKNAKKSVAKKSIRRNTAINKKTKRVGRPKGRAGK